MGKGTQNRNTAIDTKTVLGAIAQHIGDFDLERAMAVITLHKTWSDKIAQNCRYKKNPDIPSIPMGALICAKTDIICEYDVCPLIGHEKEANRVKRFIKKWRSRIGGE